MQHFTGIGINEGVAVGTAFVLRPAAGPAVAPPAAGDQRAWLDAAVGAARAELAELVQTVAARGQSAASAIIEAQLLMLDDPALIGAARDQLGQPGMTAEAALATVHTELAGAFAALDDPDLRARATDLADLVGRITRHLTGAAMPPPPDWPHILIAGDLTPSAAAGLDPVRCLGLATEAGGATGHAAIIARALGLPAVAGVAGLVAAVSEGDLVLVDGSRGEVVLQPTAAETAAAERRRAAASARQVTWLAMARQPAVTRDGRRIAVLANIDGPATAQAGFDRGAEGVGLYRTESLFLARANVPNEAEQFAAYSAVMRLAGDHPVVARTLDIGGDKAAPALGLPAEPNPFLGVRGLRLCLSRPDLFDPQLRALLRAGAEGRLAIMFPLVNDSAEIGAARAAVERVWAGLLAEGHPLGPPPRLGIMVETPAAAIAVDLLLPLVDFVSVGTNDLTGYTLATDRTNPAVAAMADPFHPALVRLLAGIAGAARAAGRPAAVCGELAGQPAAIPLLIGLGYTELSMNPATIPAAKALIRDLDAEATRQLAEAALRQPDATAIRALLAGAMHPPHGSFENTL